MSTTVIAIMFWALELTMIIGGLILARSFDNNYKAIIQMYKEMVTLINEKDDAREKVYKAQLAAFDTMVKLSTTTNEQYEIISKQYDTMPKAFENMIQMYDRLIDCEKTLNAHYYILEERYSQIYDQFEECHRQLNDIRKLVEPEVLDVTLKLDTESLVQKKEDNENDDG